MQTSKVTKGYYTVTNQSLLPLFLSFKGGILFMPLTCAVWTCPSASNYETPVLFESGIIGFLIGLLFQMAE